MAASRLTDSQKIELVERYRQGHSSADLAALYGCSPNTVSRVVKAALDPAEYVQLKQQRGRIPPHGAAAAPAVEPPLEPAAIDAPQAPQQPDPQQGINDGLDPAAEDAAGPDASEADPPDAADGAVLAIDDADDFGDDDAEEIDPDDDLLGDGDDEPLAVVPVLPLSISHEPVKVQELVASLLPDSLYMLVDKTVELQARPLSDFAELGQLPPDEQERQALQLFANPRQAKRQCGRSQRVIKMPDPALLVRRASYLQVKGISRLVVEGSLYALPGG
ncbi:MAG: helix-turn-helix domain-containing protein [Cyanobacteria bacterium REEB417]|nr:helix-turn-helix domain-containing protein [Cyanobacteria bacterium REEB417]